MAGSLPRHCYEYISLALDAVKLVRYGTGHNLSTSALVLSVNVVSKNKYYLTNYLSSLNFFN